MISKKMETLIAGSSMIRAMFEESKKLAAVYGEENVYDFSLGNPYFPPPAEVRQAVEKILDTPDPMYVHGYPNNSGYPEVREKIAASINRRFGTAFAGNNIVMSVGAAGGLNVILKTLLNPGEEIVAFAPYFGEYKNYAENFGANLLVTAPQPPDFNPNFKELREILTPKTRAVIVNSPNNPTGVIYSEETIQELAAILEEKQKEFGTDIYILADEPYRELVYTDKKVPYITKYYDNTIVGYSYSKSLSLPGDRIGYVVVPDEAADSAIILEGANTATRILGFVNAPSLMQLVAAECVDLEIDPGNYQKNGEALYQGLTDLGLECVKPEGAFYLFVKSPIADDKEFAAKAKEFLLLITPGTAFGCPGYVRLAYCTSYKKIMGSMPGFKKLMESIRG